MSTSPTTSSHYEVVTVPIDHVVPYWRNPRVISEEAVGAVMESIRRYGYQQPIVVDLSNTIVIGHTRYSALRRLGVTEVQVLVVDLPPEKVKQLRVLDNRVREFTSWDFEVLVSEIENLDAGLMAAYFPEVVPPSRDDGGDGLPDPGLPDTSAWDAVDHTVAFVCSSCFHTFEIEITIEAVKSGRLEVGNATA